MGSPDLTVRVRRARSLALDRLLERKTAEGCWRQPFDLSAMAGAAYVVMLRTTGLIEQAGAATDEMMLIRHVLRQRNRDGGFFKFPNSLFSSLHAVPPVPKGVAQFQLFHALADMHQSAP